MAGQIFLGAMIGQLGQCLARRDADAYCQPKPLLNALANMLAVGGESRGVKAVEKKKGFVNIMWK